MTENLKKQTLRGLSWSFIDNIANQGISFIVGIILARLLSPHEYGIIGIIMLFIVIFDSIVDSGFSNALIRNPNANHTDYNTVFYFNIALSCVLYFVLFLTAPWISTFFNQPQIAPLLRITGIILIINAASIIQYTILVKQINFKKQAVISIISSILSGVIGIGMAIAGYGVWSLVLQQISRQFLRCLLLWIYKNHWFPSLIYSWKSFQSLFGYGWKIMVIGIITSVWEEFYQGVIGKCYSTKTLGQFTRANQFRNIFSRNISSVIQRVTFPILSSVQEDRILLRKTFIKVLKTTAFATFISMICIGAISKSMILVFIGDKWIQAIAYLQIICFSGMWNSISNLNINLLQVNAHSGKLLLLEIPKRIVGLFPILLGIFVSIEWMLWGSVIANFCCYVFNAYYAGKDIHYTLHNQIYDILPSLFFALIIGALVWIISFINWSPFILLPIQLISALVLTVFLGEIFNFEQYKELKSVVKYYRLKIIIR